MKPSFREKIRSQIADASLQAALDANTERRVRARVNAWASLPDWRERRQKAHAVRAEVIEHLDEYLERFIAHVQANGIKVHRANNAAEATRLVLEIAKNSSRKAPGEPLLFAKAKSMVSEEIGLNHALEAAGQQVFETDLGEFIVQLRGERPSHIITPAMHLRRQQVGQLFHEKLGIAYTEDVRVLTDTARARLRQVFFSADIGLSGVNFGVAETGTLVIVSNEGNARMCASLPPVHIALMGLERILPNLDDLALCLSLLPRSATGQKLSVYTQLIQRPQDGQQKHLILLDNGRTRLRNSTLKESLYCIRCGSCLNVCPVFREIGGHGYLGADGNCAPYSGPIGSVISPGLLGDNFSQLAQASTLCGACQQACPVDIDLPKLLLRVRAGEYPEQLSHQPGSRNHSFRPDTLTRGLKMYNRMAVHPHLFAFAQKLAGLVSIPFPGFIPLPSATGWGFSKYLPKPALRSFRERYRPSQPVQNREMMENASSRIVTNLPASPVTELSVGERIESFSRELAAVGGFVYAVQPAELVERLAALLRERGIDHIQMWAGIPNLARAQLAGFGFELVSVFQPEVQAGITGALAGIAETGSLVIPDGGELQPLSATLLPAIHIAVLPASRIMTALEQAVRLPEVVSAPTSVLVTGPSRTADIEMTLTIGVHGPKELHVFVVDDDAIK